MSEYVKRHRLADGTIKEYRYPRKKVSRDYRQKEDPSHPLKGLYIKKHQLADGRVKEYRYYRLKGERSRPLLLDGAVKSGITGIYFLIKNGQVSYVGQSTNILIRLKSHASMGVDFDEYRFIACPKSHLNRMERRYIVEFNPPLNKRFRRSLGNKDYSFRTFRSKT